jgi:hypothetical protein
MDNYNIKFMLQDRSFESCTTDEKYIVDLINCLRIINDKEFGFIVFGSQLIKLNLIINIEFKKFDEELNDFIYFNINDLLNKYKDNKNG